MTFEQMQKMGYELTDLEIKRLANQTLRAYDTASREILKEVNVVYDKYLDAIADNDYYEAMLQGNRLITLNNKIENIWNNTYSDISSTMEASSNVSFSNNFYRQQYTLTAFSSNVGVNMSFSLIDPIAVELSVYGREARFNQLEDFARKARLSGFLPAGERPTLTNIINKNGRRGLARIYDTITQGFISGSSFSTMSNSVKDAFGIEKRAALRIIRTESMRNLQGAHYLANEDAKQQGVSTRRQWNAVLDSRTRTQSAVMDGQFENEQGKFTYPNGAQASYPGNSGVAAYDINERCTTISVIAGLEPSLRRARNPVTGKNEVIDYKSFNQWAKDNGLTKNRYGQIVA